MTNVREETHTTTQTITNPATPVTADAPRVRVYDDPDTTPIMRDEERVLDPVYDPTLRSDAGIARPATNWGNVIMGILAVLVLIMLIMWLL